MFMWMLPRLRSRIVLRVRDLEALKDRDDVEIEFIE